MPVTPWSLERVAQSTTAARYGIDNSVPPALVRRAQGLGRVAAIAERHGARVTSLYRSPELQSAIYTEREGRNAGLDGGELYEYVQRNRGVRPGDHTRALAVDDGVTSGDDTHAELAAAEERWRSIPEVSEGIEAVIYEGNHIHVRFNPVWLERFAVEGAGNA